uniref:Histonelysine Nmethyltransferase SETMARlike [Hydra vulgaris] n=1 Tax=Lepeophtheirus salmonis TaxID=72036 RepID=A0A0K2V2X1_LEPSM
MSKMVNIGYKMPPHPPYSYDIAPSDFFLFPNIKKMASNSTSSF